jgi:hypothetical protein
MMRRRRRMMIVMMMMIMMMMMFFLLLPVLLLLLLLMMMIMILVLTTLAHGRNLGSCLRSRAPDRGWVCCLRPARRSMARAATSRPTKASSPPW